MKFNILLLTLFATTTLLSQNKLIGLEDFRNPALQPKTLNQLAFRGESNSYVFITDSSDLVQSMAYQTRYDTILKLSSLNNALKTNNLEERKSFPAIKWRDSLHFTFTDKNALIQYDFSSNSIQKIANWEEGAENQDFNAVSGNVAYTKDGNLFVYNNVTKKNIAISKDGNHDLVYGEAAHRNEFGINKGTFWSNTGSLLAFYRMDQSMVTDYPLVTYTKVPAELNAIKYPMAGAKSHQVTVGVYNTLTNKTIYLQTGEPKDQYLTNITWSPDDKYIYIAHLNRDQNVMNLCRYDVVTGKLDKMLVEEKHPKYVEPEHNVVFIPNSTDFIIFSKKDGRSNLYQYKFDGTFVRQITAGPHNVNEVLGFSKKGDMVYVTAIHEETPLETHCYYAYLNKDFAYLIRSTHESGTHKAQLSKDGSLMLDTYSNEKTPYIARLVEAGSGMLANTIFIAPNPLKDYNFSYPLVFQLKTADNSYTMYNRMILPPNFDYSKKYPVMIYLYGGPHAQMIQEKWLSNADYFLMHMAAKGYIVFTCDNRGSANRSLDFENATFLKLGEVEMQDQLVGINYLKKQTFVDTTRIGCFGWSFGGFLTTYMTLKNPNLFKASVAGGPVTDWKMYEIMYTERYMDTPQSNPDGYKNADLKNYIGNLKSKLLLIHGQQDDVVLPQHTFSLINECIAKGILVDYFPYPNHPHNVRGKDRVHLYKKIEDYFDQYLMK